MVDFALGLALIILSLGLCSAMTSSPSPAIDKLVTLRMMIRDVRCKLLTS